MPIARSVISILVDFRVLLVFWVPGIVALPRGVIVKKRTKYSFTFSPFAKLFGGDHENDTELNVALTSCSFWGGDGEVNPDNTAGRLL